MSAQKFITVSAIQDMNTPVARNQNIDIDAIRFVVPFGSYRKVLYESTEAAGVLDSIIVTDTMQAILNAADNSGYTQNGLKQVTVLHYKNKTYTTPPSWIINYGASAGMYPYPLTEFGLSGTGTHIEYKNFMAKVPHPLYVQEDLTQSGVTPYYYA